MIPCLSVYLEQEDLCTIINNAVLHKFDREKLAALLGTDDLLVSTSLFKSSDGNICAKTVIDVRTKPTEGEFA